MALGDIKSANAKIIYLPKASGYTTPAAGDIVYFDATNGEMTLGTATSLGKHGIYTGITHVVGATTYYGVCVRGKCVCKAGGAIQPGNYVESDTNADAVEASTSVTATYVQGEIQRLWRILGVFEHVEDDSTYAPADAASTNSIVVDVGATP